MDKEVLLIDDVLCSEEQQAEQGILEVDYITNGLNQRVQIIRSPGGSGLAKIVRYPSKLLQRLILESDLREAARLESLK